MSSYSLSSVYEVFNYNTINYPTFINDMQIYTVSWYEHCFKNQRVMLLMLFFSIVSTLPMYCEAGNNGQQLSTCECDAR